MKKLMLLVALVAVLAPLAAAQEVKPNLGGYVIQRGTPTVMSIPFKPASPLQPKYCKPCLFYTGDFNSSGSGADGVFNAQGGALGSGGSAYVYDAFVVPKGKTWTIEKLFINTLSNGSAVDPTCPWDIRKGVTSGSGGTDVATGTGNDTWAATGRSGFNLTEYTNMVTLKKKLKLKAGTYYLNVLTSCLTSSCSIGSSGLFYESDQESQPGVNQYPAGKSGEQPWDQGFFNSSSFGVSWENTTELCGSGYCDQFSMGAVGLK